MSTYLAMNQAFAATTNLGLGTSYLTGAKCAIQLVTPSDLQLRIKGWSVSFSGSAAGTPSFVELVIAGAASTMSNAHSTSTIKAIAGDGPLGASRLTMGTSSSGYGNGAITTNTTARYLDMPQQIAPTGGYTVLFPLGEYPVVNVSEIVQLRVNTGGTYTMTASILFEEKS